MIKKILIGVGVLVLVLGSLYAYMSNRNRVLSPPGEEVYVGNSLKIEVKYSRPSVKGRLIFGEESAGALQPYNVYWRLGANEATSITIDKDVLMNGNPLPAGTYSVYAFPGEEEFKIGINPEWDRWGYMEPDYSQDIFTFHVPINKLETPVEQFTTRIEAAGENSANLYFEFSDVQIPITIVAQ